MDRPPGVLVCASAIGFYGKRGERPLEEGDPGADDFLADVVKQWEAACEPARQAGIRVVNTRFGIVLSRSGGALKAMLPAFRLGVAGRLGSGRQGFSWVAIDDVVAAIVYAIESQQIAGPVNVTAPHPVTNEEFTKTLGQVLHRPTVLPAPAFALRLALGEFSQEVLAGVKVLPRRLQDSGLRVRIPGAGAGAAARAGPVALTTALGRRSSPASSRPRTTSRADGWGGSCMSCARFA